jgi:pyridoxamine 5'-phosphate oxidase-like protein
MNSSSSPSPATPAEVERALWSLRAYDVLALATVSVAGPHVAGIFFAPEADGRGGIRLLLAVLRDSRKHRELLADSRVGFMCSPGNPSRWIQGEGLASGVADADEGAVMLRRLVEHAPGASVFVDRLPVVPVVVAVRGLKIVEDMTQPPLVRELGPSREAA